MPWTESGSRQEWLEEVKRRGERLRRRRRMSFAVVGALALVLPAAAVATFLTRDSGRDLHVAVAGPAPTREVAGMTPADGAGAGETPPMPPPDEVTTTTEPHGRVATINGGSAPQPQGGDLHGRTEPPAPGSSVAPGDDAQRRPGATNPAASPGGAGDPNTAPSSGAGSPPPPAAPPSPPTTAPGAANCPSSEVRVTVTTDRSTYGPGETVRGSTTIENRSAGACLLPTRGFVRILDSAGKDVSRFVYTMEYRFPVLAEPGKTFTTPFTWDQKDCSGSACVQVPAGTYTVTADWTEGGSYSGRGSFTIGA